MPSAEVARFRLPFSSYGTLFLIVATVLVSHVFFPWWALLSFAGIGSVELLRLASRRVTSIAFDDNGVDIRLLLRTHHIRKHGAEFSGSRMHGVSVRDLRTGKSYLLTTMWRGRKVVAAAEARGYAVLKRPNPSVI